MARTPLIAGNWKMHKTVSESCALAEAIAVAADAAEGREVMIARRPPPFTRWGNG